MRLLILTQKMDVKDPVLGFFHRWVVEFSKNFESIVVICLFKGECSLPLNVRVLSLGKEHGESRIKYVFNFFRHIFFESKNYDSVFVHMNQEYVLLGGLIWKLLGKKVSMWRNHHAGNISTRAAIALCDKVFCTSKFSFTAQFVKTVLMPVGIDTETFTVIHQVSRVQKSILFLARISPVKKPDLLIDAVKDLHDAGVYVSTTIVGDSLPRDTDYSESLKKKVVDYGLESKIAFKPGIPNIETVAMYNSHEIFVNLSSSGMYDKTIFEAMACGALVLASNENLRGVIDDMFIFREGDRKELVEKIKVLLDLPTGNRVKLLDSLRKVVEENHSLKLLARALQEKLS